MADLKIDLTPSESSALDSLLGAHLHQHVDEVHGSPWQAVLDFASEGSTTECECAATALRKVLADLDDEQLLDVVRRFGMDYDPTRDGFNSHRVWLTAVADVLDDPEQHRGPPTPDER